MSGVRKTFCTVVNRGAGGSSRHEGRRRPEDVALGLEEVAVARAELGGSAHGGDSRGGSAASGPGLGLQRLVARDLLADLLQRAADQARDVHLRDADLLCDLRL